MPEYYLKNYSHNVESMNYDMISRVEDIHLSIAVITNNESESLLDPNFINKLNVFLQAMNNRNTTDGEIKEIVEAKEIKPTEIVKKDISHKYLPNSAFDYLEP